MVKKITSFLIALIAFTEVFSQSVWSPVGLGTNDRVESFTIDGNYLYAGGKFTFAGGVPALHIARWDGNNWSVLGQGVSIGNSVKALQFYNGELFVAGNFSELAGTAVKNVGKWNGISWSGAGSGLEYTGATTVSTLCVYNNELYAGGLFSNSGATVVSHIAKWTGSAWVPVGTGTNGPVFSLTEYNGKLYAAGQFTNAGGVPAKNIASFDGTNWSAVGPGLESYTGATTVSTLRVFSGYLFAGGTFNKSGSDTLRNIAKWDGTSWTDVGGGLKRYTGATTVSTLIPYNNLLIAGGAFNEGSSVALNNIGQWDGTAWSPLGNGVDNTVYALEVFQSGLFAGGDFMNAGTVTAYHIAQWQDPALLVTNVIQHEKNSMLIRVANEDHELNGQALLGLPAKTSGAIEFRLFDVTGKELHRSAIRDGKIQEITVPGVTTGIYFYQLNSNGITIDSGKIVLR